MFWFGLFSLINLLGQILRLQLTSERQKDLEILYLRQQLLILKRQHKRGPHISRLEKLIMVIIGLPLRNLSREHFDASNFAFRPSTLVNWHRQIVKQHWRFDNTRKKDGRPLTPKEKRELVIMLKRENPRWGTQRIHDELRKLGIGIGRTTVQNILKKYFPSPYNRQQSGMTWKEFIDHYREQIIASDFFTVDTIWLKRIYALFFIDIQTRTVAIAGITAHPTKRWVTQRARQLTWGSLCKGKKFLIHDRDGKFPTEFDDVFTSVGLQAKKTPAYSPTANAFAERWVRSVRQECLDKVIILNEKHLQNVLQEYVSYYNQRRPHQGLAGQAPIRFPVESTGLIEKEKILGGIVYDYRRSA